MTCEGYLKLCKRSREVYLIRSVAAVLTWDLETYIPSKAVEYRADQLGYLEAKAHTLFTNTASIPIQKSMQIYASGAAPTIGQPKYLFRWSKNSKKPEHWLETLGFAPATNPTSLSFNPIWKRLFN